MAIQVWLVRADCLRVGDRSEVHGVVDETRPSDSVAPGVVFVGWSGGHFGWEHAGSLFTLVERGPAVHPSWFDDAAEEEAKSTDYHTITARGFAFADLKQSQMLAICQRALEIQAERRAGVAGIPPNVDELPYPYGDGPGR